MISIYKLILFNMFLTNLMDDLEIELITPEKLRVLIIASSLLLLSFILNVSLNNTFATYISVTLPLWISLMLFFTTDNKSRIPSQQAMRDKWGTLLMYNAEKFVKNTDLTLQNFQNLYVDTYQKDDQMREIEYKYYQQNSEIFAIQLNNKEMEYFPNEHFQLKNGKLVSVQKTDWIVTDQPMGDIYLIQDKTLRNTYISEENHKILKSLS